MWRLYQYKAYEDTTRRWTVTAIECYKRGCMCEGCKMFELYFKPNNRLCQVKAAVINSVRTLGIPPELIKSEEENFLKD